jgi:N-acetyltransferase
MEIKPVSLDGRMVRLVPLSIEHADDLTEAGNDPDIWLYMRYGFVNTREKMIELILYLVESQSRGTDLPFAVVSRESGRAIGMSRYMDIQTANRALEIGGTWYGKDHQRTGVNTECKYLLLQYAFETLHYVRVQIKTDLRNIRSQKAIERIGAVREGILRDHMILPDGFIRSSVYYSILRDEWPVVKQNLLQKMQAH